MRRHFLCLFIVFSGFAMASDDAAAADRTYDLGLRAVAVGAGGEPANDMLGLELIARYQLARRWHLGVSAQAMTFDYERPYELLGIIGAPAAGEVDSTTDLLSFNAWIEWAYPRQGGRVEWYWAVGIGLAALDADDVAGPTADGGAYDITTDIDTEVLLSANFGMRILLRDQWYVEAAFRGDQHIGDWKIRDRASGATGLIEDYFAWGGHLGLVFRF